MSELLTLTALSILVAGFLVGVVVGLTGMGGGALMTPALIFLGVGEAATVVTADLTAVRKKRFEVIPAALVNRAGPRVAQGLEAIARALHPDAFK